MKKGTLLVLVMTLVLSGCSSSMIDSMNAAAGVGVVKVGTSTFDDATIVELTPAWLYEQPSGRPHQMMLGALWSSADPEQVALVLHHSSSIDYNTAYLNIRGVSIRVGEKVTRFPAGSTDLDSDSTHLNWSGTIYTSSEALAVIPLELLRQMTTEPISRIRAHTSEGYIDADLTIERVLGQAAAIISLRQFLETIDSI